MACHAANVEQTLALLERLDRERWERQERRQQAKTTTVAASDTECPVFFWHWKVEKNKCHEGYIFLNKFYKIAVSLTLNINIVA